jgi:hypothetical protein
MTTASTPHPAVVALPAKAVSTEDWQPDDQGRYYRNFEGEIREVPVDSRYEESIVGVYAHAVQHDDGSIDTGTTDPFFGGPRVSIALRGDHGQAQVLWIDTGITLSAESTRRLTDTLVTAADELDGLASAMTTTNGQHADTVTRHGHCVVDCGWLDCDGEHGPYCERTVGSDAKGVTEPGWHEVEFWCSVISPYIHGTVTRPHAADCDQYRDACS